MWIILRITAVTSHKYPRYSKIKMSACLLLTADSCVHVIYRTAQNGPGPSEICFLKPFHVEYRSLAQCLLELFIRSLSRSALPLNLIKQPLIRHCRIGHTRSWHPWRVSSKTETAFDNKQVSQRAAPSLN